MPTPLLDPVTLRWLADRQDTYANTKQKAGVSSRFSIHDDARWLRELATRMERRIAAGEVRDDGTP